MTTSVRSLSSFMSRSFSRTNSRLLAGGGVSGISFPSVHPVGVAAASEWEARRYQLAQLSIHRALAGELPRVPPIGRQARGCSGPGKGPGLESPSLLLQARESQTCYDPPSI